MPEEIVHQITMTPYEIIATILASIALIQPWIIALWKKFFKPLKVTFIPSAKIKLYYNRSGAYIYLGGVIEAKNRSAIIKDISAKVVRQSDRAELVMDWSSFMVPVFQSIGGNSVTASEIARPFMIAANNLNPVFVEFANADNQTIDRLNQIYEKLKIESKKIANINTSFEQAVEQLQTIPEYNTYREELLENFYWKASDYKIELSISYNDHSAVIYKYWFSLDQSEVTEFKNNIDEAMQCELSLQYYQPINLKIIQRDFISLKE